MHTYIHAYRYLNPVYIIYTHAYVKRNRGNAEEKKKKKRERGFYLNSFNVTKTNNAFMWVTCAKFNQMNTGRTYSQLPYITALLLTRRSTRTFGEIVKKDTARSEVKAATGWRLKIFNRKSPCVTLERKGIMILAYIHAHHIQRIEVSLMFIQKTSGAVSWTKYGWREHT